MSVVTRWVRTRALAARRWARSVWLMALRELLSLRGFFPLLLMTQLLIGAGAVIGLGLFLPEITPEQALFLSSGAAVFPLLMAGMVLMPDQIALRRSAGAFEYLASLPVPRMAGFTAGVVIWSIAALPAMAGSVFVAWLRFDIDFEISVWAIPSALFVVAVSTAIGYAIGHGVPQPNVVALLSQLMVFVVVLFAPVAYPREQLPDWFAWIHQWFPVEHAAIVIRASITDGIVESTTRSYITLAVWLVIAWTVSYRVSTRRG